MSQPTIKLGLCCLNTTLRKQKDPIFASRTLRIKTIDLKGIEELKRLAILNLVDLEQMIYWNKVNGIKLFRLSSGIFPHLSNPLVKDYGFEFAKEQLKQ